jgi:hypothetical protein
MTPSAKRFILEQLRIHRNMGLAAVRPDGFPLVTTVACANDGLTLYFACGRNGQKVRNLRRPPNVSLTINKDWAGWRWINGLSMGAGPTFPHGDRRRKRCCAAPNFWLRLGALFPVIASLRAPAGVCLEIGRSKREPFSASKGPLSLA